MKEPCAGRNENKSMGILVDLKKHAVEPTEFGGKDIARPQSFAKIDDDLISRYRTLTANDSYQDSFGLWKFFPLFMLLSSGRDLDEVAYEPENKLRASMNSMIHAMERSSGVEKMHFQLQSAILKVHLSGSIFARLVKTAFEISPAEIDYAINDAIGLLYRASALMSYRNEVLIESNDDAKWYSRRFMETLARISIFISNTTHTQTAYQEALKNVKELIGILLESDDAKEHRIAKMFFEINRDRFDGMFRQTTLISFKERNVQNLNRGAFRVIKDAMPELAPQIPYIQNKYCGEGYLVLRLAFYNNVMRFMAETVRLRDGMNEVERQLIKKIEKR